MLSESTSARKNFAVVNRNSNWKEMTERGILLTNFNAITHPSQPNYIAAAAGSTMGVDSDSVFNIPENVTTIFDLLEDKNLTWKTYQEDIPSVAFAGSKAGRYFRKHNPAISFDSIAQNPERSKNIVPGIELAKDILSDNLPNWMFYTPNIMNDGHDTDPSFAGKWMEGFYRSTLMINPSFLEKTLILITFDENGSTRKRNHIYSLLLGAIPKELQGTQDDTYYSHYSTLNTVEQNWDLGSLNRGDADKTANNVFSFMTEALNYTNTPIDPKDIPMNNKPVKGPFI
ncbi:phosphoesterase family-domain-containing protein [Halteromyces radiatus]|uniref:phosphoesterase family-domain-containing protein n=1 Tax=Halteromyces radiatus TaxID=101107 RepID=UPI00221FC870|nr:phosphoesterase family-domain-containing protein [Halteromyces radiatus]KAI8096771.1 phosphoesterase family-domain-containing protein [Halteromyces radiatus]